MGNATLLVLAAGMGSRYGGLKQIDPVGPNGETIIDYSVYDALRAGFNRIVFVIRHDIEGPFREAIGSRFEGRAPVEYVFQELDKLPPGFNVPTGRTKPWGTAHAILMAEQAIQGPFAAINADDFYGRNSYRLLASQLATGDGDFAMVGFVMRNTLSEFGSVARGVCRVSGAGYLEGVTELTKVEKAGNAAKNTDGAGQAQALTGDEIVSMNIWGFTPTLFDHLRKQFIAFLRTQGAEAKSECFIPTVVNNLINEGAARVKVLRTPDSWFGVTYRDDRPRVLEGVRRLISAGEYPEKLWT
jgi:NDP-sugar pyrophosphorylase family protein